MQVLFKKNINLRKLFVNCNFIKKNFKTIMQYLFFSSNSSRKVKTEVEPDRLKVLFFSKFDTQLKRAYYKKIYKKNSERIFKGAVFRFIWNGWNLFNPISNGKIEFVTFNKSIYLKHKIFFLEFFVYALIFSIIPLLGMFEELFYRFVALAIIWLIYLISTLLAASRLENLFNNIIEEINEREGIQ